MRDSTLCAPEQFSGLQHGLEVCWLGQAKSIVIFGINHDCFVSICFLIFHIFSFYCIQTCELCRVDEHYVFQELTLCILVVIAGIS